MNAILQSLFALSTFSADLSTLCRRLNLTTDMDEESLYWYVIEIIYLVLITLQTVSTFEAPDVL